MPHRCAIDILDCILAEAGDFGHLLECIGIKCQEIPGILIQFRRYLVVICFKRDSLHMGMTALADKLYPVKAYR